MMTIMKIAATPPAAPPAMAAVFELPRPPGDGLSVGVGDIVEDALEVDVGVTDTEMTPEGLRTKPGSTSGMSIKNVE
jgi:hypothetical protein